MKYENSDLIQNLVLQIQESEGEDKRLLLEQLAPELESFIWSIVKTHGIQQCPQDSFQTAWIGVMKAISTYDVNKKTKFLTHCYWQILSALSKYKLETTRYENGQGTWKLSSINQVIADTDNVQLSEKLIADNDTAIDCITQLLESAARQIIEQNYKGTKKQILLLYIKGVRPVDIATKLNITRSYVSVTIRRFKLKCIEELT